jgi:CheY-like chemotaxis protein
MVENPNFKESAMTENAPPTILLVDNNAEFAYLIERYCESAGWKVVWAQTAKRAINLLETSQPHLIVLNLLIPPEGGWNFLNTCKTGAHTREIPVAAYSALPDEARARNESVDFYLWQPIHYQDFHQVLDQALSL